MWRTSLAPKFDRWHEESVARRCGRWQTLPWCNARLLYVPKWINDCRMRICANMFALSRAGSPASSCRGGLQACPSFLGELRVDQVECLAPFGEWYWSWDNQYRPEPFQLLQCSRWRNLDIPLPKRLSSRNQQISIWSWRSCNATLVHYGIVCLPSRHSRPSRTP